MLENPGEVVSVSETSNKIETYKAYESVARNPEIGTEVKAMRDVILKEGLHILSINQEQMENKNLHPVQNKSESSELKQNLKPVFQKFWVKTLKHSGHSQAPTASHKPLKHMLKPVSPSVLPYRSAHKGTTSLLGESDADCTMFSSVNLKASSSEDTTDGIMTTETNIIKAKEIHLPQSRTLREHELVQQKILHRSNLCSINDPQNNEGDTELLSANQTGSSKNGVLPSVEQDVVNNLQQAVIDDTELDQEMIESEKIDKSKLESTDSIDTKLKTLPKNTAMNEGGKVKSKLSEVKPITYLHNTVLSAVSAENSKNEWPDDNIRKSVTVKMSEISQDVEANLPVSRVTGSSDIVNSVDSAVRTSSVDAVSVMPADDAENQLQIVNGNESIREQKELPANKEDADGNSSDIVHENMRNMSLPVTGSTGAALLLTEHSSVVPQDGCQGVPVHGQEVKEREPVLSGKDSTEKCAMLTMTRNKNVAPVNEAEIECGIQNTESDPEEKLVQAKLMSETGGKEMVIAESENEWKGAFEFQNTESDPKEKLVQTALTIGTGGEGMVIAVSENESKGAFESQDTESDPKEKLVQTADTGSADGSSSSSTMNESASKDCSVRTVTDAVTENSGNEKMLPNIAQMSETVDTEMTTNIHATAALELGAKDKLSLCGVFTSVPGQDGVQLASSEEVNSCIPETHSNKTRVPEHEYKEGSTVLLEAVTCVPSEDNVRTMTAVLCVPEESNKQITAPEADNKEEPTSLPKAAMYVPAAQYITQAATSETEILGEDVASVEASSLLIKTVCQGLHGEGCKVEGSQHIERNVCNETALSVTDEVNLPLSVADKFTFHCTNSSDVPSVPEGLLNESPTESPEGIQQVEIKVKPELNNTELPVSSASEVDTWSHLKSISLLENKENFPVTSTNTSVLEHAKLSGSSSGNTQLHPLNKSPVTQNVLEETLTVPCSEVSGTETNKFNISSESERPEANEETLELSISVHETVDSSQSTDLQNNLQETSIDCDNSTVIQAKNMKTRNKKPFLVESTSKVVKLSTAYSTRSRENVSSTHSTLKDKSGCVSYFRGWTKKSTSKSVNLKKRAETSCVDDRGAKLGHTKMREKCSRTSVRNCDILGHSEAAVSHSPSKHKNCDSLVHSEAAATVSECKDCDGLVHSDATASTSSRHESVERLVGSGTTISPAKVTPEKTLCDSKSSDKFLMELTPDESLLHGRSKQALCQSSTCRRLNDDRLTCLKASALLSGKWLILFTATLCM
jgi:hypothetical protein